MSFYQDLRLNRHAFSQLICVWILQTDLTDIREKCLPVYGIERLVLSYSGDSVPDPEFISAANHIVNIICLFPNLKTLEILQKSGKVEVKLQVNNIPPRVLMIRSYPYSSSRLCYKVLYSISMHGTC